jgi:hypothetical protein
LNVGHLTLISFFTRTFRQRTGPQSGGTTCGQSHLAEQQASQPVPHPSPQLPQLALQPKPGNGAQNCSHFTSQTTLVISFTSGTTLHIGLQAAWQPQWPQQV